MLTKRLLTPLKGAANNQSRAELLYSTGLLFITSGGNDDAGSEDNDGHGTTSRQLSTAEIPFSRIYPRGCEH